MTTNRLSLRNNATSSRSGSTGSAASGSERCEECGATGTPLVTERRPRSQSPQKTSVGARRRAYSMTRKSKSHVTGWSRKIENALKHYIDGTAWKHGLSLSFMTLVWPILPTLPPERPSAGPVLTNETEKYDVNDIAVTIPQAVEEVSRKKDVNISPDSPVLKKVVDTGKKVNVTLSSIEKTAHETEDLDKKKKELMSTARDSLTDEELLGTLKSLMKKKADHEDKLKKLEQREDKLKEDLMAAIEKAKSVKLKGSAVGDGNKNTKVDMFNVNKEVENIAHVQTKTGAANDIQNKGPETVEDNINNEEKIEQDGGDNNIEGLKEQDGEDNNNVEEKREQEGGDNISVEGSKEQDGEDKNRVKETTEQEGEFNIDDGDTKEKDGEGNNTVEETKEQNEENNNNVEEMNKDDGGDNTEE